MKQEILCQHCANETRGIFGCVFRDEATPYPHEHVKLVEGTAKQEYICDLCSEDIHIGSDCVAFSAWTDYGAQYYKWEDAFINIREAKDV